MAGPTPRVSAASIVDATLVHRFVNQDGAEAKQVYLAPMSAIYTPLKLLTILATAPLAIFGLMAVVGSFTENVWVKLAIALVVALALPLFVADRMIPEDDPQKGSGLPTDVLSLAWLAFALLFFGVGIGMTRPLIAQEAQALADHGMPTLARAGAWFAGNAEEETPEPIETPEREVADAGVSDASDAEAPVEQAESPEIAEADEPLAPADLFERWAPSVVSIQLGAGLLGSGSGTGFVIDGDGLVATNHHVIAGAIPGERGRPSTLHVKLKDGTFATTVWLLDHDQARDLALLRIESPSLPAPTVFADIDEIRVGQQAISIGNPLGLEHTLTDGLVSARRNYQGQRFIQVSVPVSPGNSGGPLFNMRGQVIGVTTAQILRSGRAQNLNLAVPIDDLRRIVDQEHPDAVRVGGGPLTESGAW